MRKQRGFTLLEMIVATTVMAIAVVGLMSGLSGATRNAARLLDYDRAAQLARLKMNELLLDPRLPRNAPVAGSFDDGVAWQARLEAFERQPLPAPGQMSLDRIELEIWWMAGKERRSFTLDSYRAHTLVPGDLQ